MSQYAQRVPRADHDSYYGRYDDYDEGYDDGYGDGWDGRMYSRYDGPPPATGRPTRRHSSSGRFRSRHPTFGRSSYGSFYNDPAPPPASRPYGPRSRRGPPPAYYDDEDEGINMSDDDAKQPSLDPRMHSGFNHHSNYNYNYNRPNPNPQRAPPSDGTLSQIRDTLLEEVASDAGLTQEQYSVLSYFSASPADQAKYTLDMMVSDGLLTDADADFLEAVSKQDIWSAVDMLHEHLSHTFLDEATYSAIMQETGERARGMGMDRASVAGMRLRRKAFEYESQGSIDPSEWMGRLYGSGQDTLVASEKQRGEPQGMAQSMAQGLSTSIPDERQPAPTRDATPAAPRSAPPSQPPSSRTETPKPAITSHAPDTTTLSQPKPTRPPPKPSVTSVSETETEEEMAYRWKDAQGNRSMTATTALDHYGTTRPGHHADMSPEERFQLTMADIASTQQRWDELSDVRRLIRATDWNMRYPTAPSATDASSLFHINPETLPEELQRKVQRPPAWKEREKAAQFTLSLTADAERGLMYDTEAFSEAVSRKLGLSDTQSSILSRLASADSAQAEHEHTLAMFNTLRPDDDGTEFGKVSAAAQIADAARRMMRSLNMDAMEVAKQLRQTGAPAEVIAAEAQNELKRMLELYGRMDADEGGLSMSPHFQFNFDPEVTFADTVKLDAAFREMADNPEGSDYYGFAGRASG